MKKTFHNFKNWVKPQIIQLLFTKDYIPIVTNQNQKNGKQNQEQGKSKSTMWIVLLILSAVLNIYQWRNHTTAISNFESKVDTLVVEKVNVEQELSETKSE
ncbi:MAG: hypothetical protein IPI10_14465 [Bacteroidetes bacterium]|nr:hypothetical protein [Bacteroidota bacterium]